MSDKYVFKTPYGIKRPSEMTREELIQVINYLVVDRETIRQESTEAWRLLGGRGGPSDRYTEQKSDG